MLTKKHLILIPLLFTVLHATVFLSPLGESLEWRILRFWFSLRGNLAPASDVVIVAIDEESYREVGVPLHQSWPRLLHAKLLERLSQAGAKRVIFDVLFLDEGLDRNADKLLADAMQKVPTVLGADYVQNNRENYRNNLLLLPFETFAKTSSKIALVGFPEDGGRVQRFLISPKGMSEDLPTLAEAAIGVLPETDSLPTASDFINYYGPAGTVKTYSIYQALQSEVPLPTETFRNKIVFVGLSMKTGLGPDLKDSYLTSFSERGQTSGVEIHATAALNLLTRNWIHRAESWVEIALLSCACFMITQTLYRLKPHQGAYLLVSVLACWIATGFGLFRLGVFVPGFCLIVIVLPIGYLGSNLYSYLRVWRSQRQLERAFALYLSPEMAHRVSRRPEALHLGGEKVVATALFSDIARFTEISETMDAEEVARMLNSYFTEIVDVVFHNNGTLIKFIGDAIFALWGAPVKIPNHALLACQAAISIQEEVAKLNATGRFPWLETRIGIHTGPMVVGNLGSKRRFDFTAVGDTVNLASRIEGLNKHFGTSIIISEKVKQEIGNVFNPLYLGPVQVVGKGETVKVYGLCEQSLPDEVVHYWLQMIASFQAKQWDLTQNLLQQIQSEDPRLDKAVQLYFDQIEYCRQNSLEGEWQGELSFRGK